MKGPSIYRGTLSNFAWAMGAQAGVGPQNSGGVFGVDA